MKTNIIVIIIAVVALFFAGLGIREYYKSAERQLVSDLKTEIKANTQMIESLHKQNAEYLKQLDKDSALIIEQHQTIQKLKGQYAVITNELVAAKGQIKDFTAGQAIKYFGEYTGAKDSKMLVQGPDTSLVITKPTILKTDDIFTEHKFQKLEVVNLNRTITAQNIVISNYITSIKTYKSLVANKDAEIETMKANAVLNTQKSDLQLHKLKAQRNRARWVIAGAVGIIVVPPLLKAIN